MRRGDVLELIDGQHVATAADASTLISAETPGSVVPRDQAEDGLDVTGGHGDDDVVLTS